MAYYPTDLMESMRKMYSYAKTTIKQNEIIAQAKEAKRVVIVGGGYIGIELVEAFVEFKTSQH